MIYFYMATTHIKEFTSYIEQSFWNLYHILFVYFMKYFTIVFNNYYLNRKIIYTAKFYVKRHSILNFIKDFYFQSGWKFSTCLRELIVWWVNIWGLLDTSAPPVPNRAWDESNAFFQLCLIWVHPGFKMSVIWVQRIFPFYL